MLRALLDSYDAVELWVTQLVFPLQVLLVIVVLVPLCFGVALLLDRVGALVAVRLSGTRSRRR